MPRTGFLLVLSSPSGGGKSTIGRQCLARMSDIAYSVSYTTRKPRPGERPGVDYHFVSREEFQRLLAADVFLEWEEVHGNYYGTSRQTVAESLAAGRDVLLDIDVKGGLEIRRRFADRSVLVFVLPPSGEVLARRLRQRATDSEEVIAARLANAAQELVFGRQYDYLVINDVLEQAVDCLCHIIAAERCRLARQQEFFRNFSENIKKYNKNKEL
ncbi:MAG: guanylate kinase [Deltaproteobacteria bacterium]|nr:guanylate kinase [Deltaproteobacteria bacterium]